MTRNPLQCKGLRTRGILLDEQGAVGFCYAKAKIPRRAAAMSPPRRAAQRGVSLPQQGHGGHPQASDATHTHPRPHPRARETPYPSKYEAEKF